ncbi:MAG: hypothetical protein Q9169_008374 [Polycauliona sp. 2 TL-2023]
MSSPKVVAQGINLEQKLLQIPDQYAEHLHTILQWLAFGNEPILETPSRHDQHLLSLNQLSELSAVSLDELSLDVTRYISAAKLEALLDGLVEIEEAPRKRWINDNRPVMIVQLVPDVKEELLSENFRQGPASRFAFDEKKAKETIAIACLILLTAAASPDIEADQIDLKNRFPLEQFAALFWIDFVNPESYSPTLSAMIRNLFLGDPVVLRKWTQLVTQAGNTYLNNKHSGLLTAIAHHPNTVKGEYAPPIVWAAAFDLKFIVKELRDRGHPVNTAVSPKYVTALYMAVDQKHFDMATLLLDAGGDVADQYLEATSGKWEYNSAVSPLYNACHGPLLRGHSREWIDLLLLDKSRLGRPGWRLEVAMECAAKWGRLDIVKALIDAGADLNKGTGREESFGCPLQAACDYGSEDLVQFLLERGADPNTTGGKVWLGNVHTPLQMAAYRGKLGIVKLLLDHGADPSIQGGDFGNALIASIWNSRSGSDESPALVALLLQFGARPDQEWDMTIKLHDLNFDYTNEAKKPLSERFDSRLAEWIKSKNYDKDDSHPGSEASLRQRIEEKWARIHEKKSVYRCGCMNQKGERL